MKIYNKKLAQRIAENEARLHTIRSRSGAITPEAAAGERILQTQVNADVALLALHGYDKNGERFQGGSQ